MVMSGMSHCLASQGMQPVSQRLDNGLSVRLRSQPWLSRAALCVRVHAGSHDEPLAYPGLAHFLEHMLFLGSAGFTGEQRLMPFVQACAGQVNATTQARYTEYFCEVPADYLDAALARLLDMLARPLLGEVEQAGEREVVHAEFIARSQDSATLIDAALGQVVAEGHRCAVFQAGNRDTLCVEAPAFQAALRTFHATFYTTGNCELSIVAPQPVAELHALAQRHGQCMAQAGAAALTLSGPMLPLRAEHLRLNLPGEAGSMHLGFVLQSSGTSLDTALAVLQSRLLDESPGGLSAQGRDSGVLASLDAQVRYCHADQALLLVSFRGVASPPEALALLLDWLAFTRADGNISGWLDSYQQLAYKRLLSMTPLALARLRQEEPSEDLDESLNVLLQQLQDPLRRCVLIADPAPLAEWHGAGFPLRMQRSPALLLPVRRGRWQRPEPNPLLAVAAPCFPALGVPASMVWLPAPNSLAAPPAPMAVWQARFCFAEPLGAAVLLSLAQSSIRGLRQHLADIGISLSLDAESASLEVRLQGHVSLVPRAVALLMPALLHPQAADFATAEAAGATDRQSMPIRQLLAASAQMLNGSSANAPTLDARRLPGRHRQVRLHALGVGLDEDAQQQIAAMFATADVQQPLLRPVALVAGQHWQTLAAEGESALLLFCPQPDQAAATEACWRVLAHVQQGAFYQRLRSELQLGYAVFCSYRQIQGRRGLFMGVQSPVCNAESILAHIHAFLQARHTWLLSELGRAELNQAVVAVSAQLHAQTASAEGLAEQRWQADVAGLPSGHQRAVLQALEHVSLDALLQAQQALNQAQAGWYVLSNDQQPASL